MIAGKLLHMPWTAATCVMRNRRQNRRRRTGNGIWRESATSSRHRLHVSSVTTLDLSSICRCVPGTIQSKIFTISAAFLSKPAPSQLADDGGTSHWHAQHRHRGTNHSTSACVVRDTHSDMRSTMRSHTARICGRQIPSSALALQLLGS